MTKNFDAANMYAAYMMGWKHAAGAKAMDERALNHSDAGIKDAYRLGYTHGYDARAIATTNASSIYGYTPSILRLASQCDDAS